MPCQLGLLYWQVVGKCGVARQGLKARLFSTVFPRAKARGFYRHPRCREDKLRKR